MKQLVLIFGILFVPLYGAEIEQLSFSVEQGTNQDYVQGLRNALDEYKATDTDIQSIDATFDRALKEWNIDITLSNLTIEKASQIGVFIQTNDPKNKVYQAMFFASAHTTIDGEKFEIALKCTTINMKKESWIKRWLRCGRR